MNVLLVDGVGGILLVGIVVVLLGGDSPLKTFETINSCSTEEFSIFLTYSKDYY